ncbi:SixA phosphatase family protein [Jejudonia soesokkakensis]|uniref:SixA phosphatase family protein n=1 Tax=Jejudonia soesokkakensis TaxID=1323432 RepID=A0ABW2MVY4_9FLAO
MKTFLLFCLPIFFACNFSSEKNKTEDALQDATSTYYLIRHAEKDRTNPSNSDPSLTEEGKQRADRWATYFKDKELDAVYATNYNRTQETAKPTAAMIGVAVSSYDPRTLYNETFRKATDGKNVLIVGHSNTTPQFVNAILGNSKYQDMSDTENGLVYIVRVHKNNSTATIETVD